VVLAPTLFLVSLELGLRWIGAGYPTSFFRTVEQGGREWIVENQAFSWQFFPRGMARYPEPLKFAAIKPTNTCRIFILGESAAMGDPDPAFGFGRVLEVLLADRYRETRFEVLNVAVTAINSHVIRMIARDCMAYGGDFWIVYMGNNEVVGPFGAGTVFGAQVPGLGVIHATLALKRTRVGQVLDGWIQAAGRRKAASIEWGGMAMFAQQKVAAQDSRIGRVHDYFKANLEAILDCGERAGAQVLLSTVASNLRDCAPFASLPRPRLPAETRARWESLYAAGVKAQDEQRPQEALGPFLQALAVDDQYADLQFRLGQVYWALERFEEARACFVKARDADALRFRPDTRINEIIRHAATTRPRRLEFVDAEEILSSRSPHRTIGGEWLYEHVHLNFEGNYLLARAYAESIARRWGTGLATGAGPEREWLEVADCARRLARTPWNEAQALEDLQRRTEQVPFTFQLDHAAKARELEQKLAGLRQQTKTVALRLMANEYRAVLTNRTHDAMIWRNYGRLLEAIGDYSAAVEAWRQVLGVYPHFAQGYRELGELLNKSGRPAEARDAFQTALRLRSGFKEAWDGLGLAAFKLGQPAEAVRCYERGLSLDPAQPEVHVRLGLALASLGRMTEARRHFEQALAYDPENLDAARQLQGLSGQ
jgi:tetratricopeptide (TPR) repeat protein